MLGGPLHVPSEGPAEAKPTGGAAARAGAKPGGGQRVHAAPPVPLQVPEVPNTTFCVHIAPRASFKNNTFENQNNAFDINPS